MNTKELSQKKNDELIAMLAHERERLRDLTFRLSGARLKNVHERSDAKKNIARILTELHRR